MPNPPRLLLAVPLPPLATAVTATAFAIQSHGLVLPSDLLRELGGDRLQLGLAAFGNTNTAAVLELALALDANDQSTELVLTDTVVSFRAASWVKMQSSRLADVTQRLATETLLGVRLVARVNAGSGSIASPTLLVMRRP